MAYYKKIYPFPYAELKNRLTEKMHPMTQSERIKLAYTPCGKNRIFWGNAGTDCITIYTLPDAIGPFGKTGMIYNALSIYATPIGIKGKILECNGKTIVNFTIEKKESIITMVTGLRILFGIIVTFFALSFIAALLNGSIREWNLSALPITVGGLLVYSYLLSFPLRVSDTEKAALLEFMDQL